MSNYYDILHIDNNATNKDIAYSFKKLAMIYHPDKNVDDLTAKKKFDKILNAYKVLSNEQSRAEYDFTLLNKQNIKQIEPKIKATTNILDDNDQAIILYNPISITNSLRKSFKEMSLNDKKSNYVSISSKQIIKNGDKYVYEKIKKGDGNVEKIEEYVKKNNNIIDRKIYNKQLRNNIL
jgi:curved DNA-binding protein CbpA